MLDRPIPGTRLQRSRGRAEVTLSQRGGIARLDRLHQSGSAKAMLPNVHGACTEVVFLNTSGGLTGGDGLSIALSLGDGAQAIATTQTAERAYASNSGAARVEVSLRLGAGAALDWLPQETILFDRSALTRTTLADMATDASLLMLEMLVLGRAAMGERVAALDLFDRREVRRGGRLDYVDPVRLTSAALLGQDALLGAHRALANLVLLAPQAEAMLELVRGRLQEVTAVEAGASAWQGRLVVRMMAADGYTLRRAVGGVLAALGRRVPRVWQS